MRHSSFAWALCIVASASLIACAEADTGSLGSGGDPGNNNGGNVATGDDAAATTGTPSNDAGTPPAQGNDAGSTPPKTTVDASSAPPPVDASAPIDAAMPSGAFDQFQQHNLDVVNMYRATLNVAPLTLDQPLCTFAIAGSQELSMDHMAHQHFINASNDGSLWTSGFTSNAAENQGDPNGWTVLSQDAVQNELDQIDAIQKAMFDEGPGTGEAHGHYTNMMNPDLHRLGVGLLEVSSALYLTNDFSD